MNVKFILYFFNVKSFKLIIFNTYVDGKGLFKFWDEMSLAEE